MFSLFISFDVLISNMNQFLYWMSFFFFSYFFLNNNFMFNNYLLASTIGLLSKEIMLASKLKSNMNLKVFLMIFLFIFVTNFIGMWPYSFTMSSQLNYCFFFSLIFWLSTMMNNILNKFNFFLPHLVPSGSPLPLSQFMVLIESISQLIRPLTLAVRLMANMTAGHLIMILCSGTFFLVSYISLPLFLLVILEFMVALVQAYVFVILISMYTGEFNN